MGACLQVDLNGGLKGKDGFKGIGGVKGQGSKFKFIQYFTIL